MVPLHKVFVGCETESHSLLKVKVKKFLKCVAKIESLELI